MNTRRYLETITLDELMELYNLAEDYFEYNTYEIKEHE